MPEVSDLWIALRAETAPFTRGLRSAAEEGESFTAKMGGVRQTMTKVGAATTLVGVAFVAYGVKAAGDFQQKMNLLVTACGESKDKLKQVSDGILSLARQTGTSTNQLADGMYQVEKAGYRGADGLKVLKAASQGAREEGANLKDVTNAMTSVMASYHLKASDSVRVMNALKTAAGEGKMTMEEFSSSLSTVIPIASANKISFAQVGGAIASLTQHGTSAKEATQELANTIRNLAKPNDVAVTEMQRLGLSSTDVSTKLGQRGLTGTLNLLSQTVLSKMGKSGTVLMNSFNTTKQAAKDADTMVQSMPANLQKLAASYSKGTISLGDWRKELKTLPPAQANLLSQYASLENKSKGFSAELKKGGPAAQTYTAAIAKLTGGSTGLNTTLQLTGENTDKVADRVAKVGKSYNDAGKDVEGWKTTQASFNVQMSRLKEAITTTAITIGLKLIPVILSVITFFERHKAAAQALAVVIGTVLVTAMAAFASSVALSIKSSLVAMGSELKKAAMAIREFATAERLAAVQAKIMAAGQAILNAVMDANPVLLIVIAVVALVAGLIYAYQHCARFRAIVQAAFNGVKVAAQAVWHALTAVWNGMVTGIEALWHKIVGVWNSIASATTTAWNTITAFFRKWWPLLLIIFAPPIAILLALWNHFHTQITSAATTTWNAIAGFFKAIWNGIKTAATATWDAITTAVLAPIKAVWSGIQAIWNLVHPYLSKIWNAIKGTASSLWNSIKSAIINPITSAWHSLSSTMGKIASTIKSKIASALSAAKTEAGKFLAVGKAIVDGMVHGIENGAGSIASAAKHAASSALSSAKSFLGISSPSKKFKELGGYVVSGLVQGLTGSTASVKAAATKVARDLYVDFGDKHKSLQKGIAKDNSKLLALAKQRDSVATKLKAAQKNLAAVQKQWTDEKNSVASGIMQNASIITESPADGRSVNASDVLANMQQQVQQATQFAANLDQLRKKGLSSALIAQLATAGVDQAGATAQALASGSKGQIQQMNSMQSSLQSAANSTGTAVANSMYGAGLKSAQGLVKGLQSQESAIEKQMMKIAKSMQSAIKKALGIHSPSKVFADLGQYIPQGLAQGIAQGTHHATTAVGTMATAVVGAGSAHMATSGARQQVQYFHNEFNIEGHVLTEKQLGDVVEQQFLRKGMRRSTTYTPYKRG